MNERIPYAHSVPGLRPEEGWQPLDDHLTNVADLAAKFASSFDSAEWARNAARLHDLGKCDPIFQAYLHRENGLDDSDYETGGAGRINHSSAGAALAEEALGSQAGRVLAYQVAGHHAGLPDWHTADSGRAALSIRLEEGKKNLARIRECADKHKSALLPTHRPPGFVRAHDLHLWIRMLFSCLVDADFLDTEAFLDRLAGASRGGYKSIRELKDLFDPYMIEKTNAAPRTEVNAMRQEVLHACREAAGGSPGIYSLTVPTGGGKTLAATAFALEHATRHDKARIIYVIPYTSIIEQTVQVLEDAFGASEVVEHHSNLDPEKETRKSRLAAENWDASVVVTTNVQFFESLYAARPGRCRKLHNIVNSVVILDEAHLLPPELLTPCVDVLNALTRHYGVTVLLSTATQPALSGLDEVREIIPDPATLYKGMRRTHIHLPASLHERREWDDVAEELQEHNQVLCIVNTRRDCYDLYRHMPEGTIHLSALMCGAHRSIVIEAIRERLKAGESVRVISTQLVEAGVDLDFPVVYRALAGLDSIAQAAGRCNREGKLNKLGRLGQVHVFNPPRSAPPGLLLKGEDTTRELAVLGECDTDDPAAFTRFFHLFYRKVNDTGSMFHDWLARDVNPDMIIHFRTAAENFQFIDDREQRPVFVRYGDNGALMEQLRCIGPKRDLMRRLQRFTVNLPLRMVNRMRVDGLLEELWPGFLAQTYPGLYRDDIGLDVFRDTLPVEELIL